MLDKKHLRYDKQNANFGNNVWPGACSHACSRPTDHQCCSSLDNSPMAREILSASRVVQKSKEAAAVDILLAETRKLRSISTGFTRSPQAGKYPVPTVVSCGGR